MRKGVLRTLYNHVKSMAKRFVCTKYAFCKTKRNVEILKCFQCYRRSKKFQSSSLLLFDDKITERQTGTLRCIKSAFSMAD